MTAAPTWDELARRDVPLPSSYLFESGPDEAPAPLSLAASEYTSQAVHEREVERLWPRVWQMACRANDIPAPGDRLDYEVVGRSVALVRQQDGTIRAFRNACRHRGAAIVEGAASGDCLTCPFHGWTYGLDGGLRDVPAGWDFPHVDVASHGLVPVRCEVFDGWVFVNFDETAPTLRSFIGDTVVRHLGAWPDERKWKAVHVGIVVRANWKVVLTAFMESYHSSRVHPTVAACSGDIQSRYDGFGLHARYVQPLMVPGALLQARYSEAEVLAVATGSVSQLADAGSLPADATARSLMAQRMREQYRGRGVDLDAVSDTELVDPVHYDIFPNFLLNRAPTRIGVRRVRPHGDDHDRSVFEFMSLQAVPEGEPLPPDVPLRMLEPGERFGDEAGPAGLVGRLHDQDVEICERVQRGLANAGDIVFGARQERNIAGFHRNLADFMEHDA